MTTSLDMLERELIHYFHPKAAAQAILDELIEYARNPDATTYHLDGLAPWSDLYSRRDVLLVLGKLRDKPAEG